MPGNVKIVFNYSDKILQAVSGETLMKAAKAGGEVIRGNARVNVEKTFSSKSTGGAGLGESIQVIEVESTDKSAVVDIGPTVIYGRIQELGGVVLPVHAKLLSWEDNGERIFAKRVQIPARPYLRPALDEHKKEIETAIGTQLEKQIKAAL